MLIVVIIMLINVGIDTLFLFLKIRLVFDPWKLY